MDLTKYNDAARIAWAAYAYVRGLVESGGKSIPEICKLGDDFIHSHLQLVYKGMTDKGVAFPVCVSVNECVGYNCTDNIHPQIGDIVKVELGVEIGGCLSMLGESFVMGPQQVQNPNLSGSLDTNKYIQFLDILTGELVNAIHVKSNNIDAKVLVESKCTEVDCFPIENCTSYQQFPGHMRTSDSKYIVFNHQKYYDESDFLTVAPDLCFEFEESEVYHINLSIVQNHPVTFTNHKYIERPADIMRFNDFYYSLKLRNSKVFCHKVKSEHRNNAFRLCDYTNSPSHRMGMKECLDNGILESFPVQYTKDHMPVYSKKFTVIITGGKAKMLKYK